MNDSSPIITIDGPSGSGKGTIAKRVAGLLGWHLLDSGAIYRGLALSVSKSGADGDDENTVLALCESMNLVFSADSRDESILLNGEDVSQELRAETTGNMASQLAAIGSVRSALLDTQRRYRLLPGLVADGRDMGTTVFPAAELKIYLEASATERAERRYNQLKQKGLSANLANLKKEIAERDERDANRAVSPLRPADDAVVIDSTQMSIDEVVSRVLQLAHSCGVCDSIPD
ncbi:MAG TPA: (d)CMP kinase [Chromatiaceae bacterium]|jgi:cytidylate kinase|nr:(d)CMP kinase [Chromatiaceae bacterium]HIN81397.1 (d)CMP kinase [Chromatiales bacterium]